MQRRFKQGIAKSRPRLRASALALNVEVRFGSSRLPAKVLQNPATKPVGLQDYRYHLTRQDVVFAPPEFEVRKLINP